MSIWGTPSTGKPYVRALTMSTRAPRCDIPEPPLAGTHVKWFIEHLSTMTPMGAYLWLGGILLLCGLGLPIPEDISLIAAGYFSWKGVARTSTRRSPSAWRRCWAGDTMAFLMGRWFGRRVLASSLARRYFTPRRQLRVRAYFRKFGSKVVLVGRFTPGLRFTIFFTAGTLHVRTSTFVIYDFSAALVTVPALVYTRVVLRPPDRPRRDRSPGGPNTAS